MSENRPHLVAVSESEAPSASQPETRPAAPPARRGGSGLLTFAFALAFAVCAIGWIAAEQRLDRIQAELAERSAELDVARGDLATARGRVSAFEGHVSTARERVGALLSEMGALEAFLTSDPGEAAAEPDSRP